MSKELTADELYIARRQFQLEVYKRNGQDFENFFSKIMRLHNPEFLQVKPQGIYGDRKNDGFIKSIGQYYQVYSPEDPLTKEKKTIEKLVMDFAGLYSYWHTQITPIKEFNFVLNDKYQGAYASLCTELAKIEKQHQGIVCKPFLAHHLEDIFLSLTRQNIEDILGKIPSAEEINLHISVLNEVIQHLISIKVGYGQITFPLNPDFEDKITFNALGDAVATLLKFGSYQEGALKEYFKINSTFTKEDLKQIFNDLYKEGQAELKNSSNASDLIFFYILSKAYPSSEKVYQDAVLVLMSYFFTYCDIFEEPLKKKQNSLFE